MIGSERVMELYNAANVAGCHHKSRGMNVHGAPFPSFLAFQVGLFRGVDGKFGGRKVGRNRWRKNYRRPAMSPTSIN